MTREMNKPEWQQNWTCRKYYEIYGAKYTGEDDELKLKVKACKNQHAWTDEDGYFNKFLCLKDFKECDCLCSKHHPKMDDDFKVFMDATNERLKGLVLK